MATTKKTTATKAEKAPKVTKAKAEVNLEADV